MPDPVPAPCYDNWNDDDFKTALENADRRAAAAERRADRLRKALQVFVNYYEQAGRSSMDGDERFNLRHARKVLKETAP